MQEVVSKVRYKGKVVEEIVIPIYDSLDEIVTNVEESLIVDMFNRGNKVRLQGVTRNKYSTKTGKEKKRAIAFNLLTTDELIRFAGDHNGLTAFIDSKEMMDRVEAYLAENAPAGSADASDSDENDEEDDD